MNISKDIRERLAQMGKVKIHWGVRTPELAKIMFWNEFGTDTIPERPVYRMTFGSKSVQEQISKASLKAVKDLIEGKDFKSAVNSIGEVGLGALKNTFVSGSFKPNAPSTIKKKGAGKRPLYDTGALQANQAFEVIS